MGFESRTPEKPQKTKNRYRTAFRKKHGRRPVKLCFYVFVSAVTAPKPTNRTQRNAAKDKSILWKPFFEADWIALCGGYFYADFALWRNTAGIRNRQKNWRWLDDTLLTRPEMFCETQNRLARLPAGRFIHPQTAVRTAKTATIELLAEYESAAYAAKTR